MNETSHPRVSMALKEDNEAKAGLPVLGFSSTTIGLVSAGSIMVAILSVTICAVCWCRRHRQGRRLLGSCKIASADSSGSLPTGLSGGKIKSMQAGLNRSDPITFVLPSISLDHGANGIAHVNGAGGGDPESSAGENSGRENGGDKAANRISVTRLRQTSESWLGIPGGGLGGIDRDMYVSSEGDEASTPSVTGLGKVGMHIRYDIVSEQLHIKLLGATNLPGRFRKNSADPHVKVTILPEKSPKFFTKVQRNTLNPIFLEEFAFAIPLPQVDEKTMKVTLCDLDRFSRRAVIGYVLLPLPDIGVHKGLNGSISTGDIWRDLYDSCDRPTSEVSKGEMFLSLCHNPDASQLIVGINKTKNINTAKKDKDIAALYVKVTLFVGGKYIKTKKTAAKRKTMEPEFDETFAIQLPKDRLQGFHLLVALCARTRLGGRCILGRTQIGAFAYVAGPGFDHWMDALNSPKSIVAQWHLLT